MIHRQLRDSNEISKRNRFLCIFSLFVAAIVEWFSHTHTHRSTFHSTRSTANVSALSAVRQTATTNLFGWVVKHSFPVIYLFVVRVKRLLWTAKALTLYTASAGEWNNYYYHRADRQSVASHTNICRTINLINVLSKCNNFWRIHYVYGKYKGLCTSLVGYSDFFAVFTNAFFVFVLPIAI